MSEHNLVEPRFKMSQAFGCELYLKGRKSEEPLNSTPTPPGAFGTSESEKEADGGLTVASTKTKPPVDRVAPCAEKWAAFCWAQNRQARPPCVGRAGP